MKTIDKKITAYEVVKEHAKTSEVVDIAERPTRPSVLVGSTYKIKTPLTEYSLYLTINHLVHNQGGKDETCQPFEIFINSKNTEHYQWIIALTRIISAVFQKGGNVSFLVDELGSVFDPKGGYFQKGGKYIPSLVAEIGVVIGKHLKMLNGEEDTTQAVSEEFPASAQLCTKCNTKALMVSEGCLTCLNCGDSKCG